MPRVHHCVDLYTVHIPCPPVFANLKLVSVADEPDKKIKYALLKEIFTVNNIREKNNAKRYSTKTVNC